MALGLLAACFVVIYAARSLVSFVGDWEEAANGNLACGLVEGLVASPWVYQYQPWAHGPFVYGLILTPFFALGGSKMLWVKILGAAFAFGGSFVWLRIVQRGWGMAAALLFAAW